MLQKESELHAHTKNDIEDFFCAFFNKNRQLQALSKRLAELDKAISILRPLQTTVPPETVRRKSFAEDDSPVQGDRDVDNDEMSLSTSRRGSRRSISSNEDAESSSSKRKRSSGSSGGHQHESMDSDTIPKSDDNSRRKRRTGRSSSNTGIDGSSSILRTSSTRQRKEATASLLALIDANTAIVDTDMRSLDSAESASTAS